MRFYGDIQRTDEETRMVWGYASTEQRAMDGLVITREAMSAALDDYMEYANIREMHQPSAVGVAREASVDDHGLYIGAHVVDDNAWAKVKAGVYRAFSIGAKITERDPADRTLVRGISLREISLVDRPSDPGAKIDVWHMAGVDDDEDAPPNSHEEDMSRARKPGADASVSPAPAAEHEAAVERTAETPAEVVSLEAEAEPAQVEEPAAEDAERAADGEPAAADDPVARAVEAAASAMHAADAAIEAVTRSEETARAVPAVLVDGLEVRRGIDAVGRLGYLLSELAYIVWGAQYEAESEGDNSPVPAQLREAFRGLAAAYKAMSDEEIAELVTAVDTTTRAAMEQGENVVERAAEPEAEAAPSEDIVARMDAMVADRETLVRTVDDLTGKVTDLADIVRHLLDQPAPPRTGGSLARAVDKAEDSSGVAASEAPATVEDAQRALAAMPQNERADLLIRASLARPIPIGR